METVQPQATAQAPVNTDSATAAVAQATQQAQAQAPTLVEAVQQVQQTQQAPVTDPTHTDSPQATDDGIAKAEQRVADAQAKMHEATTQRAALEAQLTAILNHPLLGPAVKQAIAPQAEVKNEEDPVAKAYQEYQQASNDQEAFAKLVSFAEARAKAATLAEIESKALAEAEKAKTTQRDQLIVQTINTKVQELAPEIPIRFFWSMTGQAELETPVEITQPAKRLEWQVTRAIELARAELNQSWTQRQQAQAQAQAVQQTMTPVIPAGGAAPAASGTTQGTVSSFVDQIKAQQRAQLGR